MIELWVAVGLTVFIIGFFLFFAFSAKTGEDAIGLGVIFMMGIIGLIGTWVLFGVIKFLRWWL